MAPQLVELRSQSEADACFYQRSIGVQAVQIDQSIEAICHYQHPGIIRQSHAASARLERSIWRKAQHIGHRRRVLRFAASAQHWQHAFAATYGIIDTFGLQRGNSILQDGFLRIHEWIQIDTVCRSRVQQGLAVSKAVERCTLGAVVVRNPQPGHRCNWPRMQRYVQTNCEIGKLRSDISDREPDAILLVAPRFQPLLQCRGKSVDKPCDIALAFIDVVALGHG